jgi:hypothetical protein
MMAIKDKYEVYASRRTSDAPLDIATEASSLGIS